MPLGAEPLPADKIALVRRWIDMGAKEGVRPADIPTVVSNKRPRRKLDVSVYNFPDLTGQNKPNDNFAEFSRALTQGASAVLIDVLTKAG